jgi:nucleoside-diphosphate-sugar epimerase
VRALVTGATGFTGGYLTRWLPKQGDVVRALVRDPARADDLSGDGVEVVKGDLTDAASLRRAAEGVDVIYNIAALYRTAGLPAATYRAVNAEGVGAVIEAAAAAGVRRVVHCSTVGVHGHIVGPPANEDAPLKPGDVYQETKLEGERIGREAAARTGVELVITRPSGIYGPGDRRLFKLFGKIAQRRFVLLGNGEIFYHLTFVEDLCAGFRLCATVPSAAGRTFILAGTEIPTLRQVMDLTAEVAHVPRPSLRFPVWPVWLAGAACEAVFTPFGLSPPLYRRRVDFFTKSRAFDTSRARSELGFNPTIDLREGIGRTLGWYRGQHWI